MGRELEEGLIRTHQPEKLQRKRKEGHQFVELPCSRPNHSGASSRSGEPNEAEATTFRGKIRSFRSRNEEFFYNLVMVLIVEKADCTISKCFDI